MSAPEPPDAPTGPDAPLAEAAGSAPPGGSRRQRRQVKRARAHRRRRQVIGLALTFVVIAAGAAVATDAVRLSSQDSPSLAGTVRIDDAGSGRPTASTATSLPTRPCKTHLTSADPLKVWVGGDSLAGSLGPAFGTIAGATGVVQPYFHSRVSSGLSNPGFVDWPALATKEMAAVDPDIVVFIISTNDYPVALNKTLDTTTGEPAWKAAYTKEVQDMLAILEGSGRTVLWLGAPVLKDTTENDSIKELNAVQQTVIKNDHAAVYVDTYSLFADRDGKYSANVTDDTGKTIVARSGDGVHFTVDGADYLARAVFKLVDAQCRISAQAVTGQTKQTIQTAGSTQVAPGSGSSSSSGGSSNNGGGSIATTPPATTSATAPATTQPPAATQPPSTTSAPATSGPPPTSKT